MPFLWKFLLYKNVNKTYVWEKFLLWFEFWMLLPLSGKIQPKLKKLIAICGLHLSTITKSPEQVKNELNTEETERNGWMWRWYYDVDD